MSSALLDKFITATTECTKQIRTMLPMEQEKRKALVSDDVPRMEHMMCDQQAAVMKLENLEKERLHLQQEAGFSGLTANEILEKISAADKERLTNCFDELRTAAKELKAYNEKATELAKASLQFWENAETIRTHAASRTTYSTYRAQTNELNNGFSIKIKI